MIISLAAIANKIRKAKTAYNKKFEIPVGLCDGVLCEERGKSALSW